MEVPVDQLFQQAEERVQARDWSGAEHLLKSVLEKTPDHGDALHFLGLVKHQMGETEASLPFMQKAAEVTNNHPAVLVNYGSILNTLGRWREAEDINRQVLKNFPENTQALIGLATSLTELNEFHEALLACENAKRLGGENLSIYIALGNIKRRLGILDEAIQAYKRAIECNPDSALAYMNLGLVLRDKGALEDAETACRKAVALYPEYVEAHNNLGNVLIAAGDSQGALASFERALSLNPSFSDAEANKGSVLYRVDEVEAAEASYLKANKINPNNAKFLNGLGVVQLSLGKTDDASSLFRRAVEINPKYAEAVYNLASSRQGELGEDDILAVEDLITEESADSANLIFLHFALAEIADQQKDWERAFIHAQQGNAIRKELLKAEGHVFDADAFDELVDQIISLFNSTYFKIKWENQNKSKKPVFVFGMPRSGTTLVEQILASHPNVYGAGELDQIVKLINRLVGEGYPGEIPSVTQKKATQVANDHLVFLDNLSGGLDRVIDKTPFNFLYLGLITQIYPGAFLVHCVRDARDTAISCFLQNFISPHSWATDLGDIARYFRTYKRLMSHWGEVLPHSIIEVKYESLVNNQEWQSRALIKKLELPWHEICLEFHTSKRIVKTASSWQVRRPIHTKAVDRWRRYAPFLQPFFKEL